MKFFGYCFFLLAVPITRKQPVKIASFWTKKILKYYIKSDFNFNEELGLRPVLFLYIQIIVLNIFEMSNRYQGR